MKKTFTVFVLMASLSMFSILFAGEIYVSPRGNDKNAGTKEAPYLTLNHALKQAREWRRLNAPEVAGGISIRLEDGIYVQSAPLFIRPEDSGRPDSPTLISAVENAHPLISGGVAVTEWKRGSEEPRIARELRSKVWVAKAPLVGNRMVETRQMWVNGNKARRASQFPDGMMERMIDFNSEEQTITIPTPQIEKLQNAGQLEMIVHQRWAIAILRVKSIDVRGEQSMETAEVIIPVLETLMIADGTLERPIRHIHLEGITFAHTSWMRPSYQGHVTLQGGFPLLDAYKLHEPGLPEKAELENQAWITRPETAIRVRGAEYFTFNRCTFQHLASTGLDYEWAVSSSGVENCVFSDVGGTGILVGAFPDGGFETHVPFIPLDQRDLCTDITIKNNLITDVTNEDWGCVGIGAGYVSGIDISHNEVCHLNYSGICVGWGWTSLQSGMKNNRIEANYVHHFARRLYDAGGLYTLSSQPGSVVRNNRIEHLEEAPYATNDRAFYIYLDEATDGYTIENNWCPAERFDSNRPGNRNVWRKNGPQVADEIKNSAGRMK